MHMSKMVKGQVSSNGPRPPTDQLRARNLTKLKEYWSNSNQTLVKR